MKLCLLSDVAPDGSGPGLRQGRLFRQSRTSAVVMTVVLGGVLLAAPIFWRHVGAPWFVWGGCAALALLIVPMLLTDLKQKFRSTNWLLWIRDDGLYVNFRSYQDQSPTDVPCVVRFDFAEIAEVRRRVEKYTTPNDGGSTHYSLTSLELLLQHDDTGDLAAAMSDDRRREQPTVNYAGVRVTSRPAHFAVSLPTPNCVRLAWRGGTGHGVAPSLKVALAELARHVAVGEEVQFDRGDWRDLTDEQLDDQVLQLAHSGDKLNAVKLLTARRGYSTTEAKRFVDELLSPAI